MASPSVTDGEDFLPGDPANYVVGRTEKSARVHGEQKKLPINESTIRAYMKFRVDQLEPVAEEVKELRGALEALKGI